MVDDISGYKTAHVSIVRRVYSAAFRIVKCSYAIDGPNPQRTHNGSVISRVVRHILLTDQFGKPVPRFFIREHIASDTLIAFPGNCFGNILKGVGQRLEGLVFQMLRVFVVTFDLRLENLTQDFILAAIIVKKIDVIGFLEGRDFRSPVILFAIIGICSRSLKMLKNGLFVKVGVARP